VEATRRNPSFAGARALLFALFVGACAGRTAAPASEGAEPGGISGGVGDSEPVEPTPESQPADAGALPQAVPEAACHEPAGDAPVRLSCDGTRITSDVAIELHPDRPRPSEPVERALSDVAALLRRRPDLLLVRIEVFARRPGKNTAERRQERFRAQQRADALFRYLWRRQGISPERLEAVGYPFDAQFAKRPEPYPVVFVVVQHAKAKK
jgi:OmpA family